VDIVQFVDQKDVKCFRGWLCLWLKVEKKGYLLFGMLHIIRRDRDSLKISCIFLIETLENVQRKYFHGNTKPMSQNFRSTLFT
jgi:hypothetical protein